MTLAGMISQQTEEAAMVQRGSVVDERGRRWISGELPSAEYFALMAREARVSAEKSVRERLEQRRRSSRPTAA